MATTRLVYISIEFLKSFVEKIEVDDSEMKVVYTMPMPSDNLPVETVGVLPFVHNGSP